jgi:hypothetical protein
MTASAPNQRPALDAAVALSLHFTADWRRASEAERSAALLR